MKTIEECIRENCNISFSKNTGEEIVESSLSAVCIAVEAYHSQFPSSERVSDKDIEKWANAIPTSTIGINWSLTEDIRYREGLEDGAKAMRDGKIKPLDEEKEQYCAFLD